MDSLTNVGCGPPAFWGLCRGLTPLSRKKTIVTKPRKRRNIRSDPKHNDLWQGKMDLRVASWNVRSLFRPGALYQVNNELHRYNIAVAALQEVRWPGKGECNVDNKGILFYSGNDAGIHTYGTGFIVAKKYLSSVIRFDAISDRISILRIKGKFNNICLINVYAPTELADDDVKDEFYDQLELVYDQLPNYDVKVVLGDCNAKVGREQIYKPTIGMHSKHDISNDNGVRLISFASSKAMVIKSTMFPHKDIYKGTWRSPDGFTVNQIDHVVIDDRHKNFIQDVKTLRGADCDSDHYLVIIKLRCKIKTSTVRKNSEEEKFNVEYLKIEPIKEKYQLEVSNRFKDLVVDEEVDEVWLNLKLNIREAGAKILGKAKRKKRRKWWNQECEQIIARRRELKTLAELDRHWKDEYEKCRCEVRKVIKRARKQHLDEVVRNMETLIRSNESRKFYQEIRSVKKGYQPTTQMLEDDSGNLITDDAEIKSMWKDYFEDLLNNTSPHALVTSEMEDNTEEIASPTFEDVKKAIMRLKNNKAPGVDGVPSELWKYSGEVAQLKIYELIKTIWEMEKQPTEWNTGIICPIFKKGCRKKCNNYRGIALLPTAYKILSYVLLERIEPYAERILGDYQCGFRRNRSTIDQIFLLKQLMEKRWEYAQSIHSLFVDFQKAYDSIDREALYTILKDFCIPKKLIDMIRIATSECNMRIKVGSGLSDHFAVITGLKQGDALSPMLFNLVLEYVVRKVLALESGLQLNGRHKVIGYADDLALLGETKEEVVEAARILGEEAGKVGLKISRDKTEYLHIKRHRNARSTRQDLRVGDALYKGVAKFKYLGCTITDTNTREQEIDIRVQNALRCSAALHKVLVSKLLSRKTKIRIYKTIIRPILMYGCEAWTLTLKEESKLLVAERKVFRKILGPTKRLDGSWRVRTNLEIEELVAEPNIIGEIKSHRLRWLGHLERMSEDRNVKRAYQEQPTGRRPVGRPKYRWKDRVEADLCDLQAHNWREIAQDRGKWRLLVSEAKTHFGSLSHRS